uniref:(northern house mosquito) hypothetical protein n=1 Tax=Culex pipiens TaxID=7175 RepID=A0A8D8FLP7_CULPI
MLRRINLSHGELLCRIFVLFWSGFLSGSWGELWVEVVRFGVVFDYLFICSGSPQATSIEPNGIVIRTVGWTNFSFPKRGKLLSRHISPNLLDRSTGVEVSELKIYQSLGYSTKLWWCGMVRNNGMTVESRLTRDMAVESFELVKRSNPTLLQQP